MVSFATEGFNVRVPLTDFDGTKGDHGAVNLVCDTIDLLQVIGVGDDLVTGDDILGTMSKLLSRRPLKSSRAGKCICHAIHTL